MRRLFFKYTLLKKIGSAHLLDQILTKYRIRKILYKVINLEIYIGFGKLIKK